MSKSRASGLLMTQVPVLLILVSSIVLESHAAIPQSKDLLTSGSVFNLSPNDTKCCVGSSNCSTALQSPSCAFDANNSTVWKLNPGQLRVTLFLRLNAPSLVDRFEVNLDQSSVIPNSITVTVLDKNAIQWTTNFKNTCQPNESYLRKVGSVYNSCQRPGTWMSVSIPDGLFSVRNGSDGWLWWKSFQEFQLTIEANDADYKNYSNSALAISDVRLFGWDQPTAGCNCHPVGVRNSSAPCNSDGSCSCRPTTNNDSQCVPNVDIVLPTYGPISGGTDVCISGTYIANASKVTHGSYISVISKINDILLCLNIGRGNISDLNLSFPIGIHWEKPNSFSAFILTDYSFTYKPDPSIDRISPRTSILRGGIPQTVYGTNLDSVAYPYINIYGYLASKILIIYNYTNKYFENGDQFCQTINSTMLKCLTPNLESSQIISAVGDTPASIGISLDIDRYSDYTQCPIGPPDAQNCRFDLTDNPRIDDWQEMPKGYPIYKGKPTLEITGNGFQSGSTEKDYFITVGGISSEIVNLINNVITFYPPNQSNFDTSRKQSVVVKVGYYSYTVGDLKYYPTWIDDPVNKVALTAGLVVGIGAPIIIVAVIIALVYLRRRRRNNKREPFPDEDRYTLQPGLEAQPLTAYLSDDIRASVKKCTVPYNRIELDNELGKGNFGKVFKGSMITSDGIKRPVAVKTLLGGHRDIKDRVEFLEEAMLMADFCHKHVLSLIAIAIEHDNPFVVLPLMEHGDLRGFVSKDSNSFTAGELVSFSLQVASGMEYLASRKFVHRDLAARNCMINKDLLVKVADFGLARDIFEKDYYRTQDNQRPLPVRWMAIECLSSSTAFTEKSDVWSFGVLVWELMTRGKRPYSDVDHLDLKRFLVEGRRLEKPATAPDFMYDLMIRCWLPSSNERPRFKDIVKEIKEVLSLAQDADGSESQMSLEHNIEHMGVIADARKSYLDLLRLSANEEY